MPVRTLQEPFVAVMQLTFEPPAEKLPDTVAPPTALPLVSLTEIITVACHPFRNNEAVPVREATETFTVLGEVLPPDVLVNV